jgi:gamma-glutamyl hydrolase
MARRVGIVTMPLDLADTGPSIITKVSVDWLRGAGLEVVPIPYTYSPSHVRHLVDSLHGLYLQGGPVYNPRYMNLVKALLQEVHRRQKRLLEGEDGGAYFPIWGTCHGLQMVLSLYGMEWPLDDFRNEETHRGVLRLMPRAKQEGRLIRGVHRVHRFPSTGIFHHIHGVSLERFNANEVLQSHFRVLTTSRDRDGKRFVSTVEAREVPIYLTQYHPEVDPGFWWAAAFFGIELYEALRQRGPLEPRASEPKLGDAKRCPRTRQGFVSPDQMCYVFGEGT